jgi:hypothetical protein
MAKLFGNRWSGQLETLRGLGKSGVKKEDLETAGWIDITEGISHYNTSALEVWVNKKEDEEYDFQAVSPKNNKFKKLLLQLGYKQIKRADRNYIEG